MPLKRMACRAAEPSASPTCPKIPLDETVTENIRMGRPQASDEDVIEPRARAAATSSPRGLGSWVPGGNGEVEVTEQASAIRHRAPCLKYHPRDLDEPRFIRPRDEAQ